MCPHISKALAIASRDNKSSNNKYRFISSDVRRSRTPADRSTFGDPAVGGEQRGRGEGVSAVTGPNSGEGGLELAGGFNETRR